MATITVTLTNWNDPTFWSSVNSSSGDILTFSALPDTYSVNVDNLFGAISISDGTTSFVVADSVSSVASDAVMGGGSLLSHFAHIVGTAGNDTLEGTAGNDTLRGANGDDTLIGGDGDDRLEAGGNTGAGDLLQGGSGADTLIDSYWNATLQGGDDADLISVGYGDATVDGGEGGNDQDTLSFADANDAVSISYSGNEAGTYADSDGDDGTFTGIEHVELTSRNDTLDASQTTEGMTLEGLGGDDVLTGGTGNDTIAGGDGSDTLRGGGAGSDTIIGGDGDDLIEGGAAAGKTPVINLNFEDSVSSTASDDSTNGIDGVYQNGAAAGGSGWNGSGTGVVLDGTNQYVEIPDDPAFQLTQGTISIRLNATDIGEAGNDTLFSRDSSMYDDGGHVKAYVMGNGSVGVRIQDTSNSYYLNSAPGLISDGQWHHVALSFGDEGLTLYVDGAVADSSSYTGGIAGNTEPWTLGADQQSSGDGIANSLTNYFNGGLDEFAVYDTQLTPDELTALTASGVTGVESLVMLGDSLQGDAGADTIIGGAGGDTLQGGADNDSIDAGAGDDEIYGGDGADTISISDGFGADTIVGGEGGTDDDVLDLSQVTSGVTLLGGASNGTVTDGSEILQHSEIERIITTNQADSIDVSIEVVQGLNALTGAGDDTVLGSSRADTIDAGADNDSIWGGSDDDSIIGGSGNDTIDGAWEHDTLLGGDGDDSLIGGDGADSLSGGSDNDTLFDDNGSDTLDGGSGNDRLDAGSANDTLRGGTGNDTLVAGFGTDLFDGGDDFDILSVAGGEVTNYAFNISLASQSDTYGNTIQNIEGVIGGTGNDTLTGDTVDNLLDGGDGSDILDGGDGADTLTGGTGDDNISGGDGADFLKSGSGQDTLDGGEGNDTLMNAAGDDSLVGGAGDDLIVATQGADTLEGDAGNDTLMGGTGGDSLDGGADNDLLLGDLAGVTFNGSGTDGSALVTNITDFPQTQLSYELTFASTADPSSNIPLLSYANSANDNAFLIQVEDGNLKLLIYPEPILDTGVDAASLLDGNMHTLSVTWDSTTGAVEIYSDGSSIYSGTYAQGVSVGQSGTLALGQEQDSEGGGFSSSQIFEGDIYGVRLYDDIRTPAEIADTVHAPVADTSDSNLITNLVPDPNSYAFTDQTGSYSVAMNGNVAATWSEGSDTIVGGTGIDTIYGGGGSDTIDGGGNTDFLYGGDGDDLITDTGGAASDDTLSGGAGNDTLQGGLREDLMDGGDDADTFIIEDSFGADTIKGGEGVTTGTDRDRVDFSALTSGISVTYSANAAADATDGADTLGFTEIEELSLTNQGDSVDATATTDGVSIDAGGGADTIVGGTGGDTISGGDGSDYIEGGAGNDSLSTGLGNDTLLGGEGDDTLTNSDGDDSLDGGSGNDSIVATGGDDTLRGGAGDDTLFGGADNDLLIGGAGADSMDGGTGDDTYYGDGADEITFSLGGTSRAGVNPIYEVYADGVLIYTGEVTWAQDGPFDPNASGAFQDVRIPVSGGLPDSVKIVYVNDSDPGDGSPGGDRNLHVDSLAVGDTTYEAETDATADGGAVSGNNYNLFGTPNSLTFNTSAAQPVSGDDTMSGGDGADTFVFVDNFGNDSVVGGEGGTDEDVIDLSNLSGPVTVTYTGDEAGTITDGTDTITFSEIERLILTDQADVVDATADNTGTNIDAGDGNDTIEYGYGDSTVFGGDGDDYIDGEMGANSSTADSLDGGAGNDTIWASDGSDTVRGGSGNDYLVGGGDADTVDGGSGNDTIFGGTGDDVLDGGDDSDRFVMQNNFGNDTITGGEGGADDDVIDLSGLSGPVTVTYTGDEAGTITDGTDTITFSEIERIILTDQADDVDARNPALTQGVNVDARDGNDTIDASDFNDTIVAGDGDDDVNGRDGDDSIDGGTGNDTIRGANGLDTIQAGDGDDSVDAGNMNDSVDGGQGADTLVGGNGSDTLIGGTENDSIDGGVDNDSIDGGTGADTIDGGDGADTIDGGDGNDRIEAGEDASMGDDDLIYGGSGDDTITSVETDSRSNDSIYGEAGDDSINVTGGDANLLDGGADNDTIISGTGSDTLVGGTGNDSLTGGDGDDTFVFNVGDGADTITDFNAGNTGALGDGDTTNNDFIDLSQYYTSLSELRADFDDDGVLNQSSGDYSDNTEMPDGDSITFENTERKDFRADNTGIVCFTGGTLIATAMGEVPIETLRLGDLVLTRDNGPQPLVWVTSRSLGKAEFAANPKLRPILLAPGLIGAHTPLAVSRQHGVLLSVEGEERLIRAVHLERMKGHKALICKACPSVTYYHLAFERHEIIFANGAPSESFYPGPQAVAALADARRAELHALFPDLANAGAKAAVGETARTFSAWRDLPRVQHALATV